MFRKFFFVASFVISLRSSTSGSNTDFGVSFEESLENELKKWLDADSRSLWQRVNRLHLQMYSFSFSPDTSLPSPAPSTTPTTAFPTLSPTTLGPSSAPSAAIADAVQNFAPSERPTIGPTSTVPTRSPVLYASSGPSSMPSESTEPPSTRASAPTPIPIRATSPSSAKPSLSPILMPSVSEFNTPTYWFVEGIPDWDCSWVASDNIEERCGLRNARGILAQEACSVCSVPSRSPMEFSSLSPLVSQAPSLELLNSIPSRSPSPHVPSTWSIYEPTTFAPSLQEGRTTLPSNSALLNPVPTILPSAQTIQPTTALPTDAVSAPELKPTSVSTTQVPFLQTSEPSMMRAGTQPPTTVLPTNTASAPETKPIVVPTTQAPTLEAPKPSMISTVATTALPSQALTEGSSSPTSSLPTQSSAPTTLSAQVNPPTMKPASTPTVWLLTPLPTAPPTSTLVESDAPSEAPALTPSEWRYSSSLPTNFNASQSTASQPTTILDPDSTIPTVLPSGPIASQAVVTQAPSTLPPSVPSASPREPSLMPRSDPLSTIATPFPTSIPSILPSLPPAPVLAATSSPQANLSSTAPTPKPNTSPKSRPVILSPTSNPISMPTTAPTVLTQLTGTPVPSRIDTPSSTSQSPTRIETTNETSRTTQMPSPPTSSSVEPITTESPISSPTIASSTTNTIVPSEILLTREPTVPIPQSTNTSSQGGEGNNSYASSTPAPAPTANVTVLEPTPAPVTSSGVGGVVTFSSPTQFATHTEQPWGLPWQTHPSACPTTGSVTADIEPTSNFSSVTPSPAPTSNSRIDNSLSRPTLAPSSLTRSFAPSSALEDFVSSAPTVVETTIVDVSANIAFIGISAGDFGIEEELVLTSTLSNMILLVHSTINVSSLIESSEYLIVEFSCRPSAVGVFAEDLQEAFYRSLTLLVIDGSLDEALRHHGKGTAFGKAQVQLHVEGTLELLRKDAKIVLNTGSSKSASNSRTFKNGAGLWSIFLIATFGIVLCTCCLCLVAYRRFPTVKQHWSKWISGRESDFADYSAPLDLLNIDYDLANALGKELDTSDTFCVRARTRYISWNLEAMNGRVWWVREDRFIRRFEQEQQRLELVPAELGLCDLTVPPRQVRDALKVSADWTFQQRIDVFRRSTNALRIPWQLGRVEFIVSRGQVLNDAFDAIGFLPAEHWRRPFFVTFDGEFALDAGGPSREFFSLLSLQAFDPGFGCFCNCHGKYQVNDDTISNKIFGGGSWHWFEFIGRVIGKCILEEIPFPPHPCMILLKHMCGEPIELDDLQYVDYDLWRNLSALLSMSEEILASLDLTFDELVPDGCNLSVTSDNVEEYLHLRLKERALDICRDGLSALLAGLYSVVPFEYFLLLSANELELTLCGVPKVSVDDWREHTVYAGEFSERGHDHQVVQWFWRILSDWNNEERAKLLQWCSGSSMVPVQGFAYLQGRDGVPRRFTLTSVDLSVACYPRAHTCFNRIDLPLYDTEEELASAMKFVLNTATVHSFFSIE